MFWMILSAAAAFGQTAPMQDALFAAANVDARSNFGVANLLDNVLFPKSDGFPGGFAMDSVVVPGVFNYTDLLGCDSTSGGPCQRPIDAMSGSIGFAFNSKYVGGYFASSQNFAMARNEFSGVALPFLALSMPLLSVGLAPAFTPPINLAPNDPDLAFLGSGMEWSAGVRGFIPTPGGVVAGSIGYYGSRGAAGLYTTFDETDVHLVLSSVLTKGVPRFLAGLKESPWIWRKVEKLGENPLASSLYVRKLSLADPDALFGAGSALAASAPALWTGHVEQFNLGPVDLRLAVAFSPQLLVHEATLAIHRGTEDKNLCSASGGVVQLPEAPWITAEGGLFPMAQVGCDFQHAQLAWRVGLNTAEVLTAFPYSRNAVIGRITLSIGADEDGGIR